MLQFEHVAWYESGEVRILDRRVYPRRVEFVCCRSHTEVAQAITDMVTQSAGPYTAAGMGMALAAYEARHKGYDDQCAYLRNAAYTLSHARPTTIHRMQQITEGCLEAGITALTGGYPADEAIFSHVVTGLNRRYAAMEKTAAHLVKLFPKNGAILTQCFGETIIGTMLRTARIANNNLTIYTAETRPYLQGARLTATCAHEMGFKTTVITDNMTAYTMEHCGIDVFTSAADAIALDGHIANKIGTFQIAFLARHFNIPFYVTGIPDKTKQDRSSIVIEQRNPESVHQCNGIRHTARGLSAIYPAFDITPPDLIAGIVTDKGVFSPYRIQDYFLGGYNQFY